MERTDALLVSQWVGFNKENSVVSDAQEEKRTENLHIRSTAKSNNHVYCD